MELRPPLLSSDEDGYPLAAHDTPEAVVSLSKPLASGQNLLDDDTISSPSRGGTAAKTMIADPVVVGPGAAATADESAATTPTIETSQTTQAIEASEPQSAASEAATVAEAGSSSVNTERAARRNRGAAYLVAGSKLRPRRRRVRMRYLMQAWTVSLLIHLAILSALAAATFSAKDTINKILSFDSALTGFRNGEPEILPIYADPESIRRDKMVGDEHASTVGELAPAVSEGEGDEGGGSIALGAAGAGPPSRTPKVRGVGKGRINEGTSLPGVKIDGLGGSPLSLLPVAPALDLGGGERSPAIHFLTSKKSAWRLISSLARSFAI